MRKIIDAIVLCFISVYSFGQDGMSFKGIPFNQSLSEYTKQMTGKNMILQRTETESFMCKSVFKGDFAGYRDCEVHVFSALDKSYIYKVTAYVDMRYKELCKEFDDIVASYKNKYGNPTSFAREALNYYSFWNLGYGSIKVSFDFKKKHSNLLYGC